MPLPDPPAQGKSCWGRTTSTPPVVLDPPIPHTHPWGTATWVTTDREGMMSKFKQADVHLDIQRCILWFTGTVDLFN